MCQKGHALLLLLCYTCLCSEKATHGGSRLEKLQSDVGWVGKPWGKQPDDALLRGRQGSSRHLMPGPAPLPPRAAPPRAQCYAQPHRCRSPNPTHSRTAGAAQPPTQPHPPANFCTPFRLSSLTSQGVWMKIGMGARLPQYACGGIGAGSGARGAGVRAQQERRQLAGGGDTQTPAAGAALQQGGGCTPGDGARRSFAQQGGVWMLGRRRGRRPHLCGFPGL